MISETDNVVIQKIKVTTKHINHFEETLNICNIQKKVLVI